MGGTKRKYVEQSGLPINKIIPSVKGIKLNGESWDSNELIGKKNLLFFGSTMCSECAEIIPHLNNYTSSYDVNLVVFLEYKDDDKIDNYVKNNNLDYDSIIRFDKDLGDKIDISYVPFAYLLNEEGKILDKGLINSQYEILDMLNLIGNKVA